MKSLLSKQLSDITVLTYKSVLASYLVIGLEETKAGQNLVWRIWKEGIIELKIEKKIINSQRHLVIDFVTPPAYLPTWIVEDILKRRKEHA